jgi:hypothetical protein
MRQFLRSLLRIVLTSMAVITVLAVAVGRASRVPEGERSVERVRFEPISAHLYPEADPTQGPRMLNLDTGAIERVRLDLKDRLGYGSCSPWRDGRGRTHVVGLWRSEEFGDEHPMGLLRVSLPDGEVLNRLSAISMPNSPPCWFPGTSSRILYSGWDGVLYTLSFEDADAQPTAGRDPVDLMKPRAVTWRNRPLPGPLPLLTDPHWPTDPRLKGKILASVTLIEPFKAEEDRERSQLWWFQLNDEGTEIVASGRLIRPIPRTTPDPVIEERLPRLATAPDGSLVLAYLIRKAGKLEVTLRMARLTVDEATGVPDVDEAETVDVADGCTTASPAFSTDGTRVYSMPRLTHAPARARAHEVATILARVPQPKDRAIARSSTPASPKPATPVRARWRSRDRRHLSWNDHASDRRKTGAARGRKVRDAATRPNPAG